MRGMELQGAGDKELGAETEKRKRKGGSKMKKETKMAQLQHVPERFRVGMK